MYIRSFLFVFPLPVCFVSGFRLLALVRQGLLCVGIFHILYIVLCSGLWILRIQLLNISIKCPHCWWSFLAIPVFRLHWTWIIFISEQPRDESSMSPGGRSACVIWRWLIPQFRFHICQQSADFAQRRHVEKSSSGAGMRLSSYSSLFSSTGMFSRFHLPDSSHGKNRSRYT